MPVGGGINILTLTMTYGGVEQCCEIVLVSLYMYR